MDWDYVLREARRNGFGTMTWSRVQVAFNGVGSCSGERDTEYSNTRLNITKHRARDLQRLYKAEVFILVLHSFPGFAFIVPLHIHSSSCRSLQRILDGHGSQLERTQPWR